MPSLQKLISAPQFVTSQWTAHLGIICSNPRALPHVPERDQAIEAQDQHMAALHKIKSNPKQLIDLDPKLIDLQIAISNLSYERHRNQPNSSFHKC